jgi:hypothetical protein
MKRKLFIVTALLFCFVVCLATAVTDLSGKWSGSIKTPDGDDFALIYIFHVDGNKLTGTVNAQGEEMQINDGKVNGADFTFNVTNSKGTIIPHVGKYYVDSVSMDIDDRGVKLHSTLKRVTDK